MPLRILPLFLPMLLVLGACSTANTPASAVSPAPAAMAALTSRAIVTGVVVAPPGVIGNAAGNLIGQASSNVIAAGGANFRVLALQERPVSAATVYVTDAAGTQVPGTAPVLTDEAGRYALPGLPVGETLVVVARVRTAAGREAMLKTLVRTTAGEARSNIGPASTLVTLAALRDQRAALGAYAPETFDAAVSQTAERLAEVDAPDWADTWALSARMEALLATSPLLRSSIEELQASLTPLLPSGPASATPAASPTPALAASLATAPTPTPTPTPTPAPVLEPVLQPLPTAPLKPLL